MYAHSLDDLSSTFSESAGGSNGVGNLGYLDPRNPMLDYGNSDFDIRHRLVVRAIWQDPFFNSGRGLQRQALVRWSLITDFTTRTGVPFTFAGITTTISGNTAITPTTPTYTTKTTITT